MINQRWSQRNWYTWNVCTISGTSNDLKSERNITQMGDTMTIDLNQVIGWTVNRIKKKAVPHSRLKLQIKVLDGFYSIYDDEKEEISQIEDFFQAMVDAKLMSTDFSRNEAAERVYLKKMDI